MTTAEPDSAAAIAAWIAGQMRSRDRFGRVYDASEQHRGEHGPECTVYPTGSGPLLAALAAATSPARILEVGCGLGYSALSLADGAGSDSQVQTIEQDPLHAELAGREIAREGFGDRIKLLEGSAPDVLQSLQPTFGLIFWDGDPGGSLAALPQLVRLLSHGGLLISSNLFLARYDPQIPGLAEASQYRLRIMEMPELRTAFLSGGMAISVRTE